MTFCYHVLERRFWEQAQRRGVLLPGIYKTGAIWTFEKPLARILEPLGKQPVHIYDPQTMVEIQIRARPGPDGAIREQVSVRRCKNIEW